jgi:hypothetical protein
MSFHASFTRSQATDLLSETLAVLSGFVCGSAGAVEVSSWFFLSAVFGVNGEAGGVMGKSGGPGKSKI